MNRCFYTKSINKIRKKITYSYKFNNSQYIYKTDYMMLNILKSENLGRALGSAG